MSSKDEVVSFMDLLDLDEEVIDSRLKSIMERSTHTNKHLANAIHLLQYKNLINIQDESECDNQDECSFIAKIVNNIQEENIENVCKIVNIVLSLKKSCIVSNSEHLFQQIFYSLELPSLNPRGISDADSEDETGSKTLLSLRVCDSILDAVIKNGEKLTLPFLETPLENILSSTNEKLKIYFLNNTVPRLFEGILGYNILDRIWTYLQQPETNKENSLKILSCLAMFYLPVQDSNGKMKFESEIVFHFEFWNILLYGLMSNNPSARKISVYLIKRALDSLKTTKKDIHIASETKTIFHWPQKDSASLRESWDNFFILIDSLEEKQSNIVLPSLQLFESLKGIDNCWINCGFNLGLKHDNAQVRLKCVEHRLNTKLGVQFDAIVLLEALNDVNLYDNQKDCERLKSKLIKTCGDQNTLVLIIKSIGKIKWSPVPMFYLSEVLAETKTDLTSTIDCVQFIQIMIEILKAPCNNIAMRNSVRLNITYFIANCFKDLSWKDLMQIYSLVQWNKFTTESKDISPFISMINNLELKKADKTEFLKVVTASHMNIDFALLYLKSQIEDLDKFMELVAVKVQKIQDIGNRQYADKTECFVDIVYVTHLFNKSKEVDTLKDTVINILTNHYKTIIQYMLTILSDDIKLSIEEMVLLFEGYKSLTNTLNDADVKEIILQIYKVSIMFLKDKETSLENKLFTINILDIFTDKIDLNYKHEMLSLKHLLQVIKDVSFKENQTMDDNGRFRNAFYEKSCEIVYKYIKMMDADGNSVINNNINEIVEYIENVIECGGYGCLKWILRTINIILPNILENEKIKFDISQFISRTWKEIEELKSNNQYSPCMEQFVKLIIQEPLLKRPMFNNLVISYCSKIVEYGSLKTTPLAYLAEELSRKNINEDYGQLICVLCEILLFAPVPKKDIRILDNVTVQIFQNPRYGFDNKAIEAHFNFTIQYSAILTLSRIGNPDVFETLSSIIISKIEAHLKTKQRYHGNSQLHRSLLISLQHLLFLSLLNMKVVESPMIVFWMIDLLGRLPHQPSVRICLEWFIALHFYVMKTKIDKKVIQKMKSKNIPIISQFMILFWVMKHKITKKSFTEEEYQFVMDFLLSHTMGQMFNVRLNAQYLGTELHNKQQSDRYKYIIEVIEKTFVESAKDKNFAKLQEDYFVNNFDIIEHLTPSFIYYFLPQYCDIGSNENVDGIHIKNVLKEINNNIKGKESEFKKEWDVIHSNDEAIFNYDFNKICDESKVMENESSGTIQKKYIPWKNMSDIDVYEDGQKKESSSELIVVASLIDKLPNLGGMARTSEVFGVKTYVVDSVRHLQDKQFQGLSVSAERWVNIEEVRPGQPLKDYLMKKKSEGYSVVAAEQTSTSCQLQSFKFPKKTLLLLGHEKEGIPCDFLPLMDHCVEIPQQGFVRSLNVHVTAAIFVWEYSRQNIL